MYKWKLKTSYFLLGNNILNLLDVVLKPLSLVLQKQFAAQFINFLYEKRGEGRSIKESNFRYLKSSEMAGLNHLRMEKKKKSSLDSLCRSPFRLEFHHHVLFFDFYCASRRKGNVILNNVELFTSRCHGTINGEYLWTEKLLAGRNESDWLKCQMIKITFCSRLMEILNSENGNLVLITSTTFILQPQLPLQAVDRISIPSKREIITMLVLITSIHTVCRL